MLKNTEYFIENSKEKYTKNSALSNGSNCGTDTIVSNQYACYDSCWNTELTHTCGPPSCNKT